MNDFAGYARTNLFKVKDLDSFQKALAELAWPISQLQHESLGGFIWTGAGKPFAENCDLRQLADLLSEHVQEAVFIVVAGAMRGEAPVVECTVIEPSGKIQKNNLSQIINNRTVDFSEAPVLWT